MKTNLRSLLQTMITRTILLSSLTLATSLSMNVAHASTSAQSTAKAPAKLNLKSLIGKHLRFLAIDLERAGYSGVYSSMCNIPGSRSDQTLQMSQDISMKLPDGCWANFDQLNISVDSEDVLQVVMTSTGDKKKMQGLRKELQISPLDFIAIDGDGVGGDELDMNCRLGESRGFFSFDKKTLLVCHQPRQHAGLVFQLTD